MRVHISDGISSPVTLVLHPWSCIKDVKDKLSDKLGVPATRQRLFFAGQELKNTHTLNDCSISDGARLFLSSSSHSTTAASAASPLVAVYGDIPCPPPMRDTIAAVRAGLIAGLAPRLAMEGTGGTYFLRSPNKQNIAVFKAEDEEPFAPANPRGYQGVMGGAGFRAGLLSGEGAVREVAAFLMDHGGVSGVPATTRVELSKTAFKDKRAGNVSVKRLSNGLSYLANPTAFTASFSSENIAALARGASSAGEGGVMRTSPSMEFADGNTKIGSLQAYIEYDELAGDVAPQLFPTREVQKIAILDMRLFNIDRNEANILVQRKYEVLAPSLEGSRLPFSPPSVGPSHLHHHRSNFSSGFSPDNPFSFSPLISPTSSSASFFDSPTFSNTPTHHSATATPLSPDSNPSSIELPPAATALSASFNLNYPSRAHSFETAVNGSPHGKSIMKPTAAIPIPMPLSVASITAAASIASFGNEALLSSSMPSNPPSRLQARLQALKAMRQQQSTIKPTIHLIPIDHSYTLPDTLELASVDWCWMDWPQAKEPLVDELKQYVLSLDVKADIDELRRRLAIREECLKVMRISGMLLQKGVAADLTLYEIGCLTCRQNIDTPSQLEVLCAQAATLARSIRDKVRRGESGVSSRSGWKRRTNFQRDERRGSVLSVIHSQPSSPAPTTEGESSSDSQDSPPQSADSEHSPPQSLTFSPTLSMSRATVQFKPPTTGASSLARALKQQTRRDKAEECKVDDEEDDRVLTTPLVQPSILSRSVDVSSSLMHQPSRPSDVLKSQPQPIPNASSDRPALTRSNSLDLILRRSISYDDFRAVKVNKQGFSTNSITTPTVIEREAGNNSDDSEGDESSLPASSASSFSSPPTQPTSSNKLGSPPSLSLHDGMVYRVGGVLHLAGEREGRKDMWTSEEQSRLFFSCLSGLMDSAIERIASQKKDRSVKDEGKPPLPVAQSQVGSEPTSPLPLAAPSMSRVRGVQVAV